MVKLAKSLLASVAGGCYYLLCNRSRTSKTREVILPSAAFGVVDKLLTGWKILHTPIEALSPSGAMLHLWNGIPETLVMFR